MSAKNGHEFGHESRPQKSKVLAFVKICYIMESVHQSGVESGKLQIGLE